MIRLAAVITLLGLGSCASGSPSGAPPPEPHEEDAAPPARDTALPKADTARVDPPAIPDAAVTSTDVDANPAADAPARDQATPGGDTAPMTGQGTAGCQVANGLPEGTATIAVGGMNRTYILRLPANYTHQRAWPLVLALHPNGGSGIGYWDAPGGARSIRALAREKAIVVLPLALPEGGGWDWRDHLPQDLAYFDALISRLKDRLCIDTSRIFAMGFSGGGSFSGVLGCRRTDIRAFAAGSAVAYYDPKDCVGFPAAWINVGSQELIAARTAFRDYWATRSKCQPGTTPAQPSNCMAHNCPKESPVHFCVHQGGHVWPDYGTQAAWTFFSQF